MKTTNFYTMIAKLEGLTFKELRAAIVAHGGSFAWFNEDDEELEYSYPIVTAETDGFVGNVIIRKVWINEEDLICFDAVDCEHGFEVDINLDNINYPYIILDYIPPTNNIDNVTTSPLNIGQKVFWDDPEGETSGVYTVTRIPEIFEEDSVFLISNDISEAEVTIDELWIKA